MNTTEQCRIEEKAVGDAVEAMRIGMMLLRGEIYRLQETNRELTRQYAKLNDEHDSLVDQNEALIQSACNAYTTLCPDFEVLNTSEWCDLWHLISQPIELQVRAEMMKRGCKIEPWLGLEE